MRVLLTDNMMVNGGDAAILLAILQQLTVELPGSELIVQTYYHDDAKRLYPELNLRRAPFDVDRGGGRARILRILGSRLHTRSVRYLVWALAVRSFGSKAGRFTVSAREHLALTEYARADLVISCGGAFLTDTYDLFVPLTGFAVCTILGKPLLLFGHTLGPVRRGAYRRLLGAALRRARWIVTRDQRSMRVAVEELGVSPRRVRRSYDAAFLLQGGCVTRSSSRRELTARPIRIGISVRNWHDPESRTPESERLNYERSMAEVVAWVVNERKADVTFVSTCQGVAHYPSHDDQVADRILARIRDPEVRSRVAILRGYRRPGSLMEVLNDLDCFLATRMHTAILALNCGLPVAAVAYEFKSEELFKDLGLEWACIRYREVTAERLEAIVSRLISNRFRLGDEIRATIPNLRENCIAAFREMLSNAPSGGGRVSLKRRRF